MRVTLVPELYEALHGDIDEVQVPPVALTVPPAVVVTDSV